jgi:hypothetical protein
MNPFWCSFPRHFGGEILIGLAFAEGHRIEHKPLVVVVNGQHGGVFFLGVARCDDRKAEEEGDVFFHLVYVFNG